MPDRGGRLVVSCRLSGKEEAGISQHSVRRIWQAFGLKPHLVKSFKLSTDPMFVEKVRDIVGLYFNPPEKAIVLCVDLLLDNLATHKTPRVRNWFARRPRYVLHFTPTGSSWINQVERWFAKITTQAIRRGSFRSVKHLIEAIEAYIVEHNNKPQPFRWSATANSIFEKITASID